MFPFRKKTDAPPIDDQDSGSSWLQTVLTLFVVLVLIAGMIELYRRVVDRYATRVVETQAERCRITTAWLQPVRRHLRREHLIED